MKHLLIALMLVLAISTTASAQSPDQEATKSVLDVLVLVGMQESFQIPHPLFALKYLRGDAYSAWCLLHNKAERERVAANREPGRFITVFDMRGEIYGGNPIRGRRHVRHTPGYGMWYDAPVNGDTRYNRTETTRTYEIGGYGGGPMTIYNPYFIPK